MKELHQGEEFKVWVFWRCLAAYDRDTWENLIPPEKFLALMFQTQTFPFPKTVSLSCLRQGTLHHYAVIKYFYFTIPYPLLARVTLPCAGHYWVDTSVAHLKISSVLCSNTRFVFPLRSSSCKAPGSASGIKISVNSLQLRSTNCSSNKQHDKEFVVSCHQLLQCSLQTSYNPATYCISHTGHENGSTCQKKNDL